MANFVFHCLCPLKEKDNFLNLGAILFLNDIWGMDLREASISHFHDRTEAYNYISWNTATYWFSDPYQGRDGDSSTLSLRSLAPIC